MVFHFYHDGHKPVYTIHIAAELLGCHPRTLRLYEQAGLIKPNRTAKNYRLYSQHDLTTVKRICALMAEWELTLSGVSAMFQMAERFHIEMERLFEEMLRDV
ncbi:MAG: MerR family transcriptional regulator [Candidatus Margulisbacteria bacterium]|nr:MerR family transcriptional regulator [Candidatus Margulisiibacteriota bacterium]